MTERHVVALSGGADSTSMALRLLEVEPREYTFVCTPTGDELPEMFAHWKRLKKLVEDAGSKFVPLVVHSLDGLIRSYNALPNWRQRWCTRQIKIEPFQAFLLHSLPCVSYVGLRADEEVREGVAYDTTHGVTHRYPLREWGWGRGQVLQYLESRGVSIPKRTDCARCFFQTLEEWWNLWKENPEIYADAERQEAETRHTFRSPGRDTWPASLKELRETFESGSRPRNAGQLDLFRSATCRVCTL